MRLGIPDLLDDLPGAGAESAEGSEGERVVVQVELIILNDLLIDVLVRSVLTCIVRSYARSKFQAHYRLGWSCPWVTFPNIPHIRSWLVLGQIRYHHGMGGW